MEVITPSQLSLSKKALPNCSLGYSGGNSGGFPGRAFTQYAEGSLVFVSIQYRLGAYGFLGGSSIKKDGAPNAGILDQRSALEWVQRNIAAFGGGKSVELEANVLITDEVQTLSE